MSSSFFNAPFITSAWTAGNFQAAPNAKRLNDSTAAPAQFTIRIAGTISNFGLNIVSGTPTGRSIDWYKNGSSARNFAISNGATGWLEDTGGTVSISAADTFCWKYNGSGNQTVNQLRANYSASSGHCCLYAGNANVSTLSTVVRYYAINGNRNSTTESDTKATVRVAGAIQNFQVYIGGNTTSVSTTAKTRVNGANGNCTVTITNGVTGLFEDTTHTDTIADGDLINYVVDNTSGGGNLTGVKLGCAVVATSGTKSDIFSSSPGAALSQTTAYVSCVWFDSNSATETDASFAPQFPCTLDRLRILVSANSATGTRTWVVRKNAADGNGTVSIASGATGLFEDTTHTDTFNSADLMCLKQSGAGTGNNTYTILAVRCEDTTAPPGGAFFSRYYYDMGTQAT